MNTELIKRLVDEVNEKGMARYRAYSMQKVANAYELLMNKKAMAKFVVTGYEQGYLESNAAKTDYQIKTVRALESFLTGKY